MTRLQRIKAELDIAYGLKPLEKKTEAFTGLLVSRLLEDLGAGASPSKIQTPQGSFTINESAYIDKSGAVYTQIEAVLKAPDGRVLTSALPIRVKPVNTGDYEVQFGQRETLVQGESPEAIERVIAAIGGAVEKDIKAQAQRR